MVGRIMGFAAMPKKKAKEAQLKGASFKGRKGLAAMSEAKRKKISKMGVAAKRKKAKEAK